MRRRQLITSVATIGLTATAMTGCSQIDSLQQVSGVPVNTLHIAIGYELLNNNIPILRAPECVENPGPKTFDCKGVTTTNQPIVVTASAATAATFTLSPGGTPTPAPDGTLDMTMVITVGGKQIYSGSVQSVIEKNQGRPGQ